jgi:hypothetical protein
VINPWKEEDSMSGKQRRKGTPDGNAAIIKKHLVEKGYITGLLDQYGLRSAVLHRWMKG